MLLTYCCAEASAETAAVLDTLTYAQAEYEVRFDYDLYEPRLIVTEAPGGPDDEAGDDVDAPVTTTIVGWSPIFTFASRLAHTMPSAPLHMAIVTEALRFVDRASLAALEERLAAKNFPWLCSELCESTAADFLCIHRLRHMRAAGRDFGPFPRLQEYMDYNPGSSTDTYTTTKTTKEDDADGPDGGPGGLSMDMCLVS